jgi:pimeloyl-ACP methyl ester carboxylesterase
VPGIASFDLPVAGGSLAGDLAAAGFDVFVMDVRGYGASTRSKEMDEPAGHAPLVRSEEAARDIGAVVDWIRAKNHVGSVSILGWATGGQWAEYYASEHPDHVSAIVALNSLYRGSINHPSLWSRIGYGAAESSGRLQYESVRRLSFE